MSDISNTAWKQEEIDKMLELYKENYSAERISRAIGRTRNAVIGKLHRLGFQKPKPSKVPQKAKVPVFSNVAPFTPVPEPEIIEMSNSSNVLFSELVLGQCCFIIGKNSDGKAICCGGEAVKKEYCQTHLDLCYI